MANADTIAEFRTMLKYEMSKEKLFRSKAFDTADNKKTRPRLYMINVEHFT